MAFQPPPEAFTPSRDRRRRREGPNRASGDNGDFGISDYELLDYWCTELMMCLSVVDDVACSVTISV